MPHVTCRLTVKNWDQLRNPMLGNRVWATFTFFTPLHAAVQGVTLLLLGATGCQSCLLFTTFKCQQVVVVACAIGLFDLLHLLRSHLPSVPYRIHALKSSIHCSSCTIDQELEEGGQTCHVSPMYYMRVHIGATWRIRLTDVCMVVVLPCVKLSRPLV